MARRTVVGMAHCIVGHEAEVIQAASVRLRQTARAAGRIDAFLFEDRHDPSLLIHVGRWKSETAFSTTQRQEGLFGQSDWYVERPTISVFQPLRTYAMALAPAQVATLAIIECAPVTAPVLRRFLLERRQTVNPREYGIVELELSADVQQAGRFLFFVRWQSQEHVDRGRTQLRSSLDPEVTALGGTIRRYDGRVRAETAS
jgi:heme-degrading monooxygenase HmoA